MVMVSLAWCFAYFIRFSGVFPVPKGIPDQLLYFKMIPFICVIWLATLAASGFYKRTGHHRSAFVEALDILQSCFFATLAFIAFTYIYTEYRYSRVTMALFAIIHPWMIIFARSLIRKSLRLYRRKALPRKVLIIGSGDTLRHAIEMSRMGDLTRGEIAGVILVGDDLQIKAGRKLCQDLHLTVFDIPKDWPTFFSQNPAETVVFALPHRAYEFLDQQLETIADQVPDIKLIPDILRYTRFAAGVDVVNGTPVVNINDSPLAGMGSVLKRLLDIAGAMFGLVMFGPLMAIIALLVRLSSRGPIFYRQQRMGLDGRTFHILKFRSMPLNAEASTGAIWSKVSDSRPTTIGRWLRKTSLDELPQLINIVKGDMSIVGPRPERPVFVEQFRRKVPGYYLRHKVKAGLTGWAQVNGWRGNTSIEKRIECDLFYIQNWSVWFDMRIIFLTIFRGFLNKNAY